MARPPFDPEKATPQQKTALAAVDAARAAYDRAERNLWRAIETAREAKVPNPYLEKHSGIPTSTVYRLRSRWSGSADGANGEQG